jgi:hypothetical protein
MYSFICYYFLKNLNYAIQLSGAEDSGFQNQAITQMLDETSYNLKFGLKYYLKVKCSNVAGISPSSTASSFVFGSMCLTTHKLKYLHPQIYTFIF